MARPRKRFCPQGHDKDAKNGIYWRSSTTTKGTLVMMRVCAQCARDKAMKRYKKLHPKKEKT